MQAKDVFSLADIDRMLAAATKGDHPLAPITVGGNDWYVLMAPGTVEAEHIVKGKYGEWYAVPANGQRRKLTPTEQALLSERIRQMESPQ